jgi:hypothetical protein
MAQTEEIQCQGKHKVSQFWLYDNEMSWLPGEPATLKAMHDGLEVSTLSLP